MSFGPQRYTEGLAYVRAIKSAVAGSLHPALPRLARGQDLFELHAADGTLIAVADSREAAMAGAASFQLEALQSSFMCAPAFTPRADAPPQSERAGPGPRSLLMK